MQINRILNTLIELAKLAITENEEVELAPLANQSYSGYLLEAFRIEPSNNKSNEFKVTGRISKAITVGTEIESKFTPVNVVKCLLNTNKDYGDIVFDKELTVYGQAGNTRGLIIGVEFTAIITIVEDNSEEDTSYTIKDIDLNTEEQELKEKETTTKVTNQQRG